MTYLRRAIKYFIQLTLLFALIVGVLMLINFIPKEVTEAFRNGWDSIFLILGIFALMGAIYPMLGYGKRTVRTRGGDPAEYWGDIDAALSLRGYVKAGEGEDGTRRYHLRSGVNRAARLWEDTIRITPVLEGFQAEGLARDLSRVVMSIEHKINSYE